MHKWMLDFVSTNTVIIIGVLEVEFGMYDSNLDKRATGDHDVRRDSFDFSEGNS